MNQLDAMEPFTGAVLRKFFEKTYDAKVTRQVGSHVTMEMPDGRTLRCMSDRDMVTRSLMRWNAKVLNTSYTSLRRQIAPIQDKSKPRFRPQETPKRTISKREALGSLDDLIGDVKKMRGEICNGQRDPVVYQRIHDAARRARRSLCAKKQRANR